LPIWIQFLALSGSNALTSMGQLKVPSPSCLFFSIGLQPCHSLPPHSLNIAMAQASHIGLDLREVNAEADTLNTSPTSDLSGSTLVTSLSSSGAASFESVLLQAAEEISLEARKSDYCFSPLVHYDDHYYDIVGFQEGEYEQRQLVEAAEQSSVEACCPSPLIYYDCLYHDYLDFQESEYEQQQLIEAAEREEMTSKTENRAMSPSSHYEAPSPPSERGPVSCYSLPL